MTKRTLGLIVLLLVAVLIGIVIGNYLVKTIVVPSFHSWDMTGTQNGATDDTPVNRTGPATFIGTEWVWIDTVYADDTVNAPVEDKPITMFIRNNGTVSVEGDCNVLTGTYTSGQEYVATFSTMSSTRVFCDGSQETAFMGDISKTTGYSIEGNTMLLTLAGGTSNEGIMKFTRKVYEGQDIAPSTVATSTVAVEDSTFKFVSYNGTTTSAGDYTVTFGDVEISAKFCNTMAGEYEAGVSSLKATELVSTLMNCTLPSNLMDIETAFAELMNKGALATMQGNTLTLTGSSTRMVFTKVSE